MNWYARMIYPNYEGYSNNGHYDLQLEGTYTFDSIGYTNPVFSYYRDGDDGYLWIFNRSLSVAVYGNYANYVPFNGYHYNQTTSSNTEQYHAFLTLILGEIDLSSRQTKSVRNQAGSVIGYATTYRCINKYKDYRVEDRNCFCAVGDWVNALGDNRFYGFASLYPYTAYKVQNMLANYPQYWTFAGSYSSY